MFGSSPRRVHNAGLGPRRGLDGIGRVQQFEQVADLVVHLGGMSHLRATVDRIVIAPAHPPALDETCLDEVGDDSLRGTLGDPDRLGHVAKTHVSVTSDAEEHLGVVGDEPPPFPVLTT